MVLVLTELDLLLIKSEQRFYLRIYTADKDQFCDDHIRVGIVNVMTNTGQRK